VFCCDAFRSQWSCDVEACADRCNSLNGDRVLIEDRPAGTSDDCACSAGGWRGEIIIKWLKETFKAPGEALFFGTLGFPPRILFEFVWKQPRMTSKARWVSRLSTMIPGSRHKYLHDHRRSRRRLHTGDGKAVDAGSGEAQGLEGQCGPGKVGAANGTRSAETAS